MSSAEADDSSVNGRLRPRKNSLVGLPPPPPPRARPARKPNDDKTKKPLTPTKKPPEKADDSTKSVPYLKSLCPYCSRRFGSRNSVSKHIARTHSSGSKTEPIECQFCKHSEVEAGDIVRHMVDSHPNQYFACLQCHSRFPSTAELAVHKLHVCERQKPHSYRNKLRQKAAEAQPTAQFSASNHYTTPNFNGIVISCELKPCQERDTADIEDNITTNLIMPSGKNSLVSTSMLEKNAVIVLDDIQWNKRMPPNFTFHNSDADQILSRLGVVHRSPRTSDNSRWYKHIEDTTKFERCFDTSFYSKVASNVQENLTKFLDGSFNRFQLDPENVIKTRRAKNSVVINTAEGFPILLAHEQYSRNLFDSYMPRAIAPKHKWKWDSIESDRHPINPDQIKRDSHVNNCIITLVSSLDIWTQLRMRRKFEAKFNISSFNEKNTEKQNLIVNELKEILESREIPRRDSVCQTRHSLQPVASTSTASFPGSLGLMRATPPPRAAPPAVLSGEWVRPRCYVCCACGDKAQDSKQLAAHISAQHPLAQVSHYEVVGESLLGADILKHLYVPPSQPTSRSRPLRGVRECTKCRKPTTLEELHQHMLECAGDTPTVRRKVRTRPFGVRRRRTRLPDEAHRKKSKVMRRAQRLKNHMRPRPRIRTEVGDAETIRKMIADLPAKRHRVTVTTPNTLLRPRRMRDQPRNKLLMKRRPSDDPKVKKLRGGKDFASPGTSGTPNKSSGTSSKDSGPSGTQRYPITKPRISRIATKVMRQSDVLKRKTLKRSAKRKARAIIAAHFEDPPLSASSSKTMVTESLAADNTPDRIDVNKEAGDPRGHASREGNGSQDGRKTGGRGTEQAQNEQNNRPAQNTPLKHSIARLTAATETHDKSVQFQPHFLVQQECYKNMDRPVEPQRLFENDIAAAKVDKPPLFDSNQSDWQKNKANKPRKRLNDCIAMLKNKLIEPISPGASAGHRSVQCDTADMPQYSTPPMPQLPEYITKPLVSPPAPSVASTIAVVQQVALSPSDTADTERINPCLTTPPSLSVTPFTAESPTVTRSTRYRSPASPVKTSVTVTRSSSRSSAAKSRQRQLSASKPNAVAVSPPCRSHSTDGRATRRSVAKAQPVVVKVPPVQSMGPPCPVMPPTSSKSPVNYTPWALSKSPVNVRPPSPAKSLMNVSSPLQEKSPGYYSQKAQRKSPTHAQSAREKSPANVQVPIEPSTSNTYARDKSPGNYTLGASSSSQLPLLYMPQSYAQSPATYPPRAPERLSVNPPLAPSKSPVIYPTQAPPKSPVNYPTQTPAKSPINYPPQGAPKSPVNFITKSIPKSPTPYSQPAPENTPAYYPLRKPATESPVNFLQKCHTMADMQGPNGQPAPVITSQPPTESLVAFSLPEVLTSAMSPLVIEPPHDMSVAPLTAAKSPKDSPPAPSNVPQVDVTPAMTVAVTTHIGPSYVAASSPSSRGVSKTTPGITEASLPAIPMSNPRPVDMLVKNKYPLLQMAIPPAHAHTSAVSMISPLDLSGKTSGPTFFAKSTYEDSYETLDLSNKGANIDNKSSLPIESTNLTKDDVVDLCIKKSKSLEVVETLDLSAKLTNNKKDVQEIVEPVKHSEPLQVLPEAEKSHDEAAEIVLARGSESMLKQVFDPTLKIPQFTMRPTTSTCTRSDEKESIGGDVVPLKSATSSMTVTCGPSANEGSVDEISNTPDTTMIASKIAQVSSERPNTGKENTLTPIEASIAACTSALSATMTPQLATSLMNSLVSLPRTVDTAMMTTTSTSCTTLTEERRSEIVVPIGSVEDLETAKKIAMLPKEILEILGKMPTDHRNQLLDVLPQYMVYSSAVKQLKLVVDISPDSLASPIDIAKLASSKNEIATQTSSTSTEEVCPPEFLNVDTEKYLIDPFTGAITERAQQETETDKAQQDKVMDMNKEANIKKVNVEETNTPPEKALNLMAANKEKCETANTFAIPPVMKINKSKEGSEKTASLRAVRIKTSERRMSQQNASNLISKSVQQVSIVRNSVVSEKEELRTQLKSKTPPAIQQAEVSSTQQNGNKSIAADTRSPVATKDINIAAQNQEHRSSTGIDKQDSSNSISVLDPTPKTITEPALLLTAEESMQARTVEKSGNLTLVPEARSRVPKKVTKKSKCKVVRELETVKKDDPVLSELSANKISPKSRNLADLAKTPDSDESDDDLSLAVILKNKNLNHNQELDDNHEDNTSKKGKDKKTASVTKDIPAMLPPTEIIEIISQLNENEIKELPVECNENKIQKVTAVKADVHTLQTKKNNEPACKKKKGRRRFASKQSNEDIVNTKKQPENSTVDSVSEAKNTINNDKENNEESFNITIKNMTDKVNSDSVLSTVDTRMNHNKPIYDEPEKDKQEPSVPTNSSIEKTDKNEGENLKGETWKTKPDILNSTDLEETSKNISISPVIETNITEKKSNIGKRSKKRKKRDLVETATEAGTINSEFTVKPERACTEVRSQAEEFIITTPVKCSETPKVQESKVQFVDIPSIDNSPSIEEDAMKTKLGRSTRSKVKDSPKTVSSDDLALSLCSGDSAKPLRRSRRGKSMFVETPILDTPEPMQTDIYMESRAPLTKKQLIFSKLLLDEENNAKMSSNSAVPPVVEGTQLVVEEYIEELVTARADHSDYTPDVTMDESNCLTEPVNEIRKSTKRKKSPHPKQQLKRKKSYDKDQYECILLHNELPSKECQESFEENSQLEICDNYPQTEATIDTTIDKIAEEVTTAKEETEQLQIEPENTIGDIVGTKESKNEPKKPKHSTEKRKCERAINITATSSPKVKKTKKQSSDVVEMFDKGKPAPIEDSIKDTSIRQVEATKPTTCYDIPRAVARTRAKSLLIKSFMDEIYDPYDIDLEDKLLQNIEPRITKKARPVQDKQEQDMKPISKDSEKRNAKQKSHSSISSDDINKTVTSSDQGVTPNGKDNSSDSDSSKSDVPLKKYADENAKAQKKGFKDEVVGNSGQECPVPSEQPDNKRKTGGKRSKKVEEVAEDEEESPEKQLENAEELRSEQFMESFGFFSERKPRKSNLLASKKISETFHIIANENDDVYFRNKERAAKRGDRRKSASVSHTYDLECTARGIAHCHARRGRRGRRKRIPNPLTFCELCRKEFRRPDNYLRHQITFDHVSRLSANGIKADANALPDIPSYLVIYRQHLDRLRRLTEKLQRKQRKLGLDPSLIKIPTTQDIIADAKIHQYNLQKNNVRRGLSRDEALFLHCCELLKSSQNEIPSTSYSHMVSETVTSRSIASSSTAVASTSTAIGEASSSKCNDGDVDSITAKTIMESEEVRNLENDLISGIKEAVTQNLAAASNQRSYDYDTGMEHTSDLDAHDLDLDSAVPELARLAQRRRSSVDEVPDKLLSPKTGDSPFEELDSAEEPARVRKARRSTAKLGDILDIDLFEDKFDKIKRKCRSQAAAAKNTQPSTEPSPSTSGTSCKVKKKAGKKKGKKNSKNQNMIMTKGALKGFDGFKVSIPTTDINMAAIVSGLGESPRGKKKGSGKNRREQAEAGGKPETALPGSSGLSVLSARDPPAGARSSLDVYEFLDNDDADLFPSGIKDRYKTFKAPSASREPFSRPDDDSASGSDGDDFVYMSDDYPCSADETENSVMSCELPTPKVGLEPKKSALKRKDVVEKNAVMGKIFKNNAVRAEKKSNKGKEPAKSSTANLDQLFDSLLEEEPAGIAEKPVGGRSGRPSPLQDSRATPLPNSDSDSQPFGAASPVPAPTPVTLTLATRDASSEKAKASPDRRRRADSRRWPTSTVMSPSSTLEDPQPGTSRDSLPYELSDGEADGGVARHRARRKCTVGKQNVLAESWSSESEPDGTTARANSTESVLVPMGRKKKGKKGSGGQQAPKRLRHVTFKKQEAAPAVPSPTPPVGPAVAEGGGRPAVPSPYAWSPEGETGAPAHAPQHGWIVGNSHKKLVTMLAHAKGRHREDKRTLDE